MAKAYKPPVANKTLNRSGRFDYSSAMKSKLGEKVYEDLAPTQIDTEYKKVKIDNRIDSLKYNHEQQYGGRLEDYSQYSDVTDFGKKFAQDNSDKIESGSGEKAPKELTSNADNWQAKVEKIIMSKDLSKDAKMRYVNALAKMNAAKARGISQDVLGGYIRSLEAQKSDIDRSAGDWSTLKSVYQSAAAGVELLISPARLGLQGEDEAMAYQEASQLLATHDPDNVMDKYLNLAAQNLPQMSATIGAAMIPGIGMPLSSALMSTTMGTDMYLDLRRRNVPKEDATATSIMGGLALGSVEMLTGHALAGTVGKIPVVGKLFGEADRGARLRALRSLTGEAGDLTSLYRATRGTTPNLRNIHAALKAAFGSSSSKAGAIASAAREIGTEALTGGVEEWIQTGMEMSIVEAELQKAGLEGIMPRKEDGSIDGKKVLSMMNDSFIAGMILEGAIGGGMATRGIGSRMEQAQKVGSLANELKGMTQDSKGQEVNLDQFSSNAKDYLARHILMAVSAKGGGKAVVDEAIAESISTLTDNPIEAVFIQYTNPRLKMVKPGEHAQIEINGKTINIVKAGTLPKSALGQESGARYSANPQGGADIGVTDEVWAELEARGMNKDVIAINMFQGSTLPHEIMHVVGRSLKGAELDNFLDTFNEPSGGITGEGEVTAEQFEVIRQERAAQGVEKHLESKNVSPISTTFKDAFYRLQVATMGDSASIQAKQSVIYQQINKTVESDKPLGIGRVAGVGVIPATGAVIGKGVDTVRGVAAGAIAPSGSLEGPPTRAQQVGARLQGIGVTAVNKVRNAAAEVIRPADKPIGTTQNAPVDSPTPSMGPEYIADEPGYYEKADHGSDYTSVPGSGENRADQGPEYINKKAGKITTDKKFLKNI